MIKKLAAIAFLASASLGFGQERIEVNPTTRNVKNAGNVNFAVDKLRIGNVIIKPPQDDVNIKLMRALGSTIKAQRFSIERITTTQSLTSGTLRFAAVYLETPQTITGVKWWQATAGVYTASNNNYVALYSYDGAGTLTQVAISANDGEIWKAASNTLGSAAFVTPYVAIPGVYFIASLYFYSAQTTSPALGGAPELLNAVIGAADFTNTVRLVGNYGGPTTLPATVATSSLDISTRQVWLALY